MNAPGEGRKRHVCVQINWQRHLGGGEIYTRFLTRALQDLGWEVRLIVEDRAAYWKDLGMEGVQFLPIRHGREIPDLLRGEPALVLTHTTLPPETAAWVAERHRLAGMVHMPLGERNPLGLAHYHRIFAVSGYVRETLLNLGYSQVHEQPLLGVADLTPREPGALVRRSPYDWDRRKFRDRALSWFDPLRALLPAPAFTPRPGLTLGLVSRITPIKQFPVLFRHLAPVLADFPQANVEIFGSGGYASVRDLRRELGPIRGRVRFWGMQPDPAAIYPRLDYVLSGLPEREALVLNLIEAHFCGTPVIAVAAPPFTETVAHGETGFLYRDPRQDGGQDFRTLMQTLLSGKQRPDPRHAVGHLEKFTFPAFRSRVEAALAGLTP